MSQARWSEHGWAMVVATALRPVAPQSWTHKGKRFVQEYDPGVSMLVAARFVVEVRQNDYRFAEEKSAEQYVSTDPGIFVELVELTAVTLMRGR